MRTTRLLPLAVSTCVSLSFVFVGPPLAGAGATASPWRFRTAALLPTTPGGGAPSVVACPAPTQCVAGGTNHDGEAVVTSAAERAGTWRWTGWDAVAPGHAAAVLGAACPTTSACVAVGDEGTGALAVLGRRSALGWSWTLKATFAPSPGGVVRLVAVACPSPTQCVAVGVNSQAQSVATWVSISASGWRWATLQVLPGAPSSADSAAAIACASRAVCWIVGTDAAGQGVVVEATAQASGWTFSAPEQLDPDGAGGTTLTGVGCPSPSTCLGVGRDTAGAAVVASALRSGGTWTWGPATPVAATRAAALSAISCEPGSCVAVGTTTSGGPVALRAAGDFSPSAWSAQLLQGGPAASPTLSSVACSLFDDCVATGMDGAGDGVAVTSLAAPEPPLRVAAIPGNASATIRWLAPDFDGGAPLGAYLVHAEPGTASCIVPSLASTLGCRIGGLHNGLRYRFVVTARNGYGSTTSAPSNPVVPSRYQPPVPSPLDAAVRSYVASRPGEITVCVDDLLTGQRWTIDPSSVQHTASIVKVEILATLLYDHQESGQPLTSEERELATGMIEESDNDDAQQLYVEIGQLPGLEAFGQRIGLTDTSPSWAWGFTDTTSVDQTRVFSLFAEPNKVLDQASRAYGLGLLRHVDPEQAWGISAGPPARGVSIAIKNGWYPTGPGNWQVNSEGWVTGLGRSYLIAVLTRYNAEMATGVSTIETISTMVWDRLARHGPAGA